MAKKTITLSPGESKSVSFEMVPYEARVHLVSVDGLAGSFIATPVEVPMADLYGIVTDAETGSPLEGAWVIISTIYKEVAHAITSADGTYRTEDIEPGRYWLIFTATGYKEQVFEKVLVEGDNEINIALVPGAWILPTGHIDPADEWDYEANAYDGYTDTYAENWTAVETWSSFIELTISPTYISAVRYWATSPLTPKIVDVDVYYGGAWHHVYEGELINWSEMSIPGGTQLVTKARFRMYNRSYTMEMRFRLHEFQFWGSQAGMSL